MKEETLLRNSVIIDLRAAGYTYDDLAKRFNLSKSFVYKICNPDKYTAQQERTKRVHRNTKMDALNVLGAKCVQCGFDDIRALQIDHINGDGAKDRKKNFRGYKMYKSIINKENLEKYQVLCANCNWIKRAEMGEEGGRRRKSLI